jgi:Zn-finger protein
MYVTSKKTGKEVWSCKKCAWIHDKEVAKSIQKEVDKIPESDRDKLLELRTRLLE